MAHHASPESDTDRIYVCSHCPKRYARKDYLERHELNHTRPRSVCPACGKGFARPDVLRKHLSTSCKSRRGSDGDAPAPLTTAEEDALVPRKRRRPQRRNTNVSADSFGGSDDGNPRPMKQPVLTRGYSYPSSSSSGQHVSQHSSLGLDIAERERLDRLGRLDSRLNGRLDGRAEGNTVPRQELLRNLDPSTHDSSALSDREYSTSPRFDDEPRFSRSMPPPPSLSPRLVRDEPRGDVGADGPARAGASLDLPLAPAFAATPETLGSLSFTPKAEHDFPARTECFNLAIGSDGMPALSPVDVGSAGSGDDDNSVHGGGSGVEFPSVMPAEVTPELSWTTGSESAESVDDLFSWLFNVANTTGQGTVWPNTPGLDTASLKDDVMVVGADSDLSGSLPTPPEPAHSILHGMSSPHQSTHFRALPPTGTPFPPLPEHWRDEHWCLPPAIDQLDSRAREEVLNLFEGSVRNDMLNPAFSLSQMRLYFELYFTNFAPLYPIIHRPSLAYRRLSPDLLLAILCIGTAFAEDKEGFHIALRIHKRLRNRIFDIVEDEPRAPLHALQTILLINHFSRCYCSVKEHDVAQVFHSPSIIMARLAGVFVPTYAKQLRTHNPLDHWLEWVAFEERKRIGWLAFLMDTANASLFRHYLLVHCTSVQLDWPASEDAWNATSPFAWNKAQAAAPTLPSFRNALRDIISRGAVASPTSEFRLWILLHGLVSVSWTLLWRDLGDLSMIPESRVNQWKDSLRRAFVVVRDCLANLFVRRKAASPAPIDMHVYWAGIPFAHLGCILVLTDTESVRIFAGERAIAGRPVSPGEWAGASAYVHSWARSQDGADSCAAAVALLDSVFMWAHESRSPSVASIVPWCCYVASLVIWAYAAVHEGPEDAERPLEAYILPQADGGVKIEPSLARRDALDYLVRLRVRPDDLPAVPHKNRCAGPLAYTAYLTGTLGRSAMEDNKSVLLRLLSRAPA